MDTTTQGISEKRASEASAERSSSTSSVVKLVPRRPLISVRLGLTSSGLTSDLSAASSEAPVPDYADETVSTKVVKIIQSYTGVVDKMVWRKA